MENQQEFISQNCNDDHLLTQKELARILHIRERTTETWRLRGEGPPFVRISRRCVRYRVADVRRWVSERVKTSTSAN